MSISAFFAADRVDVEGLGKALDAMSPSARLEACRSLDRRAQRRLFDAAKGVRTIALEHFVPANVGAMKEVVHEGRNTLPAFRFFQKRFCRPDGPSPLTLWGYNEQTMRPVTGPGYFVAKPHDDEGHQGVVIDYTEVPPTHPQGWPEILPNSARLSRFIYNGTRDVMRGVSTHVSIGRASRKGEWMDAWFVLCRQDRP